MFTIQYREPIWLDREVVKTKMALTKDSPYHFNTVIVDGDHRETATEVLLPLAMEALHKDLFVDKALPEAIQKVEDLNAKMAEVDAKISEMDSAIAESRQATIENRQRVDMAVAELTELITGFMAMLGGDGLVTEEIDGDVVDKVETEVEINEVE